MLCDYTLLFHTLSRGVSMTFSPHVLMNILMFETSVSNIPKGRDESLFHYLIPTRMITPGGYLIF